MADTTQGDTDGQYLARLVSALIALIPGLLIHSFIIGVNVNDWWKGRSVTPVDLIVTYLGISRMCSQCADTLHLFMNKLFRISFIILDIVSAVYGFFSYGNFWLTSLLSIVLCLKISNLHTRLFLYLRGMIEHKTGHLIATSGLLCLLNSLTPLSTAITEMIKDGTYNITLQNLSTGCNYNKYLYNCVIAVTIPLVCYCISSFFLFTSLYHHTTKMRMSSNLSINLETYYSAMRFVFVTFIYNTLYIIGHFLSLLYYYFHCVDVLWLYIILDFLPVLHSSYLIYRTAKLRSQMSKVLENVIDLFSQSKGIETKEKIEIVAL